MPPQEMSRRTFLRIGALGVGALLMGGDVRRGERGAGRIIETGNVSIRILYARHAEAIDNEAFTRELAAADVFAPELIGWTKEDRQNFNRVSRGKMTPDEFIAARPELDDPFSRQELAALFGMKKRVALIDLPREHESAGAIIESLNELSMIDFREDFAKAFSAKTEALERYAEQQKQRERYMLAELEKLAATLAPDRRHTILLTLGTVHTAFYRDLKGKGGREVVRSFNRLPYSFCFLNEYVRRKTFARAADKELAAKVFFEILMQQANIQYFSQPEGSADFERKILSRFTADEIQGLYEYGRSFPDSQFIHIRAKFRELARQKGL